MIRFGFGVLLAVSAVLAGWAMRAPDEPYAERIDVQDLSVEWAAASEPTVVQPPSGFIDREEVLEDGTVVVEGWLRVTTSPFYIEVTGSTPIRKAAGFSYLRADLPSAEGARAFSIVLEPDSEEAVPVCLEAVVGGERQRLSTPSCP